MSEIQENTEAKLAAYIDGELEGTERAEIEKLLELNPNYRRMLDQLRITRDLLRNLPRESAPPELAEAFNGQLERSILLDGVEGRSGSMTVQRWPQWAAVAAIVLLTVGLGAVVYFVLPKGRPQLRVVDTRKLAATENENAQPTEENADREPQRDAIASTPNPTNVERRGGALGTVAGTAPSAAQDPQGLALNVYSSREIQELLTGANSTEALNRGASAGPATNKSDDALVVVVQSNDPRQIDREVTQYFNTNSIAWETVPAQMQVQLTSNLSNLVSAQTSSNALNSPAESQNDQNKQEQRVQLREQAGNGAAGSRAFGGGITQTPGAQPSIQVRTADAATQPSTPSSPAIDNIYIARKLSRRQAQDLSDALGQPTERKLDLLRDEMAAANAPQQVAADKAQQQQQAQSVGRQRFAYWRSRLDMPQSNESPKDALVQLQANTALSPARSATTRPAESEAQLSDAAKERGFAGRFAGLSGAPTTAPAERPDRAIPMLKAAAPRPTDATTAPAGDLGAADPSGGPVDVVIVVQAVRPASNPTMAPADAQPRQ